MKVAFTGTQSGLTSFQETELRLRLSELDITEFINGDCIGADAESCVIAAESGILCYHLYPSNLGPKRAHNFRYIPDDANWHNWNFNLDKGIVFLVKKEKPEGPLLRNQKMVNDCDMLIACPKEIEHTLRSGTWSTVRKAWHAKKKVLIIPPIIREENEK